LLTTVTVPIKSNTTIGEKRSVPIETGPRSIGDGLAFHIAVAAVDAFGIAIGEDPSGLHQRHKENNDAHECDFHNQS